jgi:hypothetical protein
MKKYLPKLSGALIFTFIVAISAPGATATSAAPIDVRHLQTCLKEEGSSLDVLVLMDSSGSLRNSTPEDPWWPNHKVGSDPEKLRGKILLSSLQILQSLAQESGRTFQISLRNFGSNSNPKELQELKSHWKEWSPNRASKNIKGYS